MPTLATVPLSQLRAGDAINARKHGRALGVDDLTASIRAHGLLQPLVVREVGKETYEIIDGNTRFLALQKIHGKKGGEAPVSIVGVGDGEALAASLAANVVRHALHPVDEYEAYAVLIGQGKRPEQIAQEFGTSDRWVRERLQLANLAPELREAWKAGKLDAEQAKAFSSVPDHDRQRELWKKIAKTRDEWTKRPDSIRRELREKVITQDDRRVKIIGGLDAYKAAGGTFTEDLFSESQNLTDGELLDRLVSERVEAIRSELLHEGWSWAKTPGELEHAKWDYPRLSPLPYLDAAGQKAFKAAKYQYDQNKAGAPGWAKMEDDPEARAKSGVIIEFDYDGDLALSTLHVMPEAEAAAEGADDEAGDEDDASVDEGAAPSAARDDGKPRLSQALHERVAQMASGAMQAAIVTDQHTAICALTAAIKSKAGGYGGGDNPLRISVRNAGGGQAQGWDEHFQHLLPLPPGMVLNHLVSAIAGQLDFTDPKFDSGRNHGDWKRKRQAFLTLLAGALPEISVRGAIAEAFDPEIYFSGCTGPQIDEAMVEMGAGKAKGKKAEKVATAASAARSTGWLPPELRTPHYQGPQGEKANG